MKVQVEVVSPIKKSLRVEIPKELVSREISLAYSDLNKKVKMPGFRPGKVPFALLEKKYGASVMDDVIRKLIPDYYQKALKEIEITPVAFPSFDAISAKKGEPLSFTAIIECRPEISIQDYHGIVVPKKKLDVTDNDIEKALTAFQEEQSYQEVEENGKAVASSHFVSIDFEGFLNGKPLQDGKQEGFALQVGSNTFPPLFESALIGKKKGDTFEVDVPYPETFENKEIAGKTVHFSVALQEIKKKVLPALDDELAKDAGHETLLKFKEHLRGNILLEKEVRQKQEQKKMLVDQLIAMHSFEVPPSLVKHELEGMLKMFQNQNMPDKEREALSEKFKPMAHRRVQETLILSTIAENEKILVTDQEIEGEIKDYSEKRGKPFRETKRAFQENEGALEGLRSQLRESRALDRVFSQAKFEETEEKGEKV
ncbi:MAG: trigger factor [Nitrospiria bacterium]